LTTAIPNSLPQAAPITREGMNTPLDTLRPYVITARKKNTTTNTDRVIGPNEPETQNNTEKVVHM